MSARTWNDWIREIDDDLIEPVVYDRFENEVSDPWLNLTTPSDEEVLAELAATPLPAGELARDDAECAIIKAFGAIMQREQNAIDKAAEQAELDQWLAKERNRDDLLQLVSASLRLEPTDWHHASGGSCYARFRGLKIRVSDHRQVPGGGWNESTGERMGEADCDFHLNREGTHNWSRETIRKHVATTLLESGLINA